MTWLLILTLLTISLVCAFYGTSLIAWTIAMAVGIVAFGATGTVSLLSLAVITVVFAAVAVPLNVLPWRQQFISAPFLKQFRRMLPEISETEQVALDAGTVGWEGELFAGNPDWKILKKQPNMPQRPQKNMGWRLIPGPFSSFSNGSIFNWILMKR